MATPHLGQEERAQIRSILTGQAATAPGEPNPSADGALVARYLEREVFARGDTVIADAFRGYEVAVQLSPESFGDRFYLPADRRFAKLLEDPHRHGVDFLLVPNPALLPQDAVNMRYPDLWAGAQPGFTLVTRFTETDYDWKLYKVVVVPPSGSG